MTTHYLDPSAVGVGAGTQEDPYSSVASISLSAGDTIRIRAGVPLRESIEFAGLDDITIEPYGEGSFLIECGGSLDYGIKAGSCSNLLIDRPDVTNAARNGIYVYNDAAGTTESNIVIRHPRVSGTGPGLASPSTEADIEIGTGILIRSGPTVGTSVIDGVIIENPVCEGNGKHGIDFRWRVLNAKIIQPGVNRNGSSSPGHGLSFHPVASTITSGWTATGTANVYSRPFVSTNDNPQRMVNNTTSLILDQNTSTPTTPSAGQWGRSGTTLYVNLGGTNPNGQSLAVKRHPHGPFDVYGGEANGNITTGVGEGHGVDADDLSGPVRIYGLYAADNEGRGIMAFRGEGVEAVGCICERNATGGIHFDRISDGVVDHNWAHRNVGRGIAFLGDARDSTLRNNLSTFNGLGPDDGALTGSAYTMAAGGVATLTEADNQHFGNGGASQVVNVTDDETDPLMVDPLTARAGLHPDSPVWRAGTFISWGTLDHNGKPFSTPSDIGPFARRSVSGSSA